MITIVSIASLGACNLDSSLPQHASDASADVADAGPDGTTDGSAMFADDFEAYARGTALPGQGGWHAHALTMAPVMLAAGNGLGSTVLSGITRTGDGSYTAGNFPAMMHALPRRLRPADKATLSVDAYAFTSHRSHAAGASLAAPDLSVFVGWQAAWYLVPDREQAKWRFDCPGGSIIFHGAFDELVRLEAIVDGAAGMTYGRITHSGGVFETPHCPITPTQIANLTEVVLTEDFRDSSYLGLEYDNVHVVIQ